ncbi:MAG: threonine synthase, partial [Anaerolineae bacterium]
SHGCPKCRDDKPSNVVCTYDYDKVKAVFTKELLSERPPTLWRYKEFLPPEEENIVSMGEGLTPLVKCLTLGKSLGLKNLYVKDESRNPTWSFKDRLASSSVSTALQFGARVIMTSSTGNHGAATAAYAARAGLDCIIFTVEAVPGTMRTLMQAYGARVVAVPSMADRWKLQQACEEQFGWYSNTGFVYPPVGYEPYGVDGYKSIGFEICEQLGWRAPDKLVVPVGYGGGFFGSWKGFEEFFDLGLIDTKPQMIAAEVWGPLKNALAKGLDYVEEVPGGSTVAFSAAVTTSTYQALKALLDSGGIAETASDEEIMQMQLELAASEGIYGEAAGVLPLAVIKKLRDMGKIDGDETVVALLTSGGLKDPAATQEVLPEIPLVEPSVEALREGLAEAYGCILPSS